MLAKLRKQEGFTLIELLIVVAIIGILAAIAIPQFSAYRMRGYNSTALSDMKNAKTAEESLYADAQCYGEVDAGNVGALLTDAAPAAGSAGTLQGPLAAAVGGTTPVAGGRISGVNAATQEGAMPVGLSNGVNLYTNTSATGQNNGQDSYVLITRHELADSAYASDSDNTTVTYRVVNSQWANRAAVMNQVAATVVVPTVGADNFGPSGTVTGGGLPTDEWTIM